MSTLCEHMLCVVHIILCLTIYSVSENEWRSGEKSMDRESLRVVGREGERERERERERIESER